MGDMSAMNEVGILSEEIVTACSMYGDIYSIISVEDAEKIRTLIESKFAVARTIPLWERVQDASSLNDVRGWACISDFTKGKPIYVFFEPHLDKSMVREDETSRLTEILGETTDSSFTYLNLPHDYLICFNDHDTLIGVGTAKHWIAELRSAR